MTLMVKNKSSEANVLPEVVFSKHWVSNSIGNCKENLKTFKENLKMFKEGKKHHQAWCLVSHDMRREEDD